MSDFPVQYDADQGVIRLTGKGGASVMLAFLLKAKFGEALDPEVLFHPELAEIMTALRANGLIDVMEAEGPFDAASLAQIARKIVGESWRSGWWSKSRDEQIEFIQDVVVAPHRLSNLQIEQVLESIDDDLFCQRRILDAADAARPIEETDQPRR